MDQLADPKAVEAAILGWRPRVRWFSALALGVEIVAIALVTSASYGWSTDEFSSQDAQDFSFKSSVLDLHIVYGALLLLQTVIFWVLPSGDAHYRFLYCANAALLLYVAVKTSLFEWDSHAVPVLGLILALTLIRIAPIVIVHREVKRFRAMDPQLYEALNEQVGDEENGESGEPKPELTFWQLAAVLRPYFWPSDGADSAFMNRLRSCSTWFCVGASKACSITAPLFLAVALNALADDNLHKTYFNAGIYVTLLFAASFFKEMQSLVYLKVKQQAYIEIAQHTFAHLHTLSLQWHLKKKTGGVLRSMDRGTEGANTLVTYLFLYLVPSMAECLAVCVVFIIAFNQWQLSLLVFGGVGIYACLTIKITLWRKKFREATNKHDNDFHDKATDSIINYETVKYFTNEQYEVKRFTESVIQYQQNSTNTQASLSVLNVTQQIIIQATAIGCMLIAAKAVIDGDLNLGDFVAVNAYVLSVFTPLAFLGTVYNAIITAVVDMRNLSQLLAEQPDVTDPPRAGPLPVRRDGMSIEFRDVHFNYPEQPQIKGLKGVSFIVPAGTTTAVVGHTGAGKTTISRLLFRFYDPVKGAVALGGTDIKTVTQTSVRGVIGVVPQDTVMFNDTILHNLMYGRMNATMEEVEAAAQAAQIKTFIESLPEKWNTVVGERGLKLSGGEKQRVAIARCLLKDPPIVLLDEATSALDTRTEASIQEGLQKLGIARTTLIIAHRLSTIKHADQIIVLDSGVIIERGTHEELMRAKGEYHGLWQMQLREESKHQSAEETKDGASALVVTDVDE